MANHILFSLMEHPNQYWRPLQLSILRMRERCCLQVLISTQFLTRMSCQHHPTRNFLPKSIWTEISPLDNNNHRETVLVQPFFSFQKDACYTMFGRLLELLCQLVGFHLFFLVGVDFETYLWTNKFLKSPAGNLVKPTHPYGYVKAAIIGMMRGPHLTSFLSIPYVWECNGWYLGSTKMQHISLLSNT